MPRRRALCTICVSWLARRVGSLRTVHPILTTASLGQALEHYRALGFETEAYDGGGYGFASRDGVELHFGEVSALDPATNRSSCYLHVADADALHDEWAAAVTGRLTPPEDTPYGMREGAHVDPDGNVLRFGSPMNRSTHDGVQLETIAADDPVAVAARQAIQDGEVEGLRRLLDANPALVTARIGDGGMSRTLLHIATDWPGHFRTWPRRSG